MSDREKSEDYSCRTFADKDEQAVEALVESTLGNGRGKDYWVWKYKSNPSFEPSLVAVAEANGKVIGCDHWIIRDLRLTDRLNAKVVVAADLVVDPAFRGKGVGTRLLGFLRSSTGVSLKKKEVLASYMVTGNSQLNKKLFHRSFGYVPIKDNTVTYYQVLNLKDTRRKVDSFAKSESVNLASNQRMRVLFNIRGIPNFILNIDKKSIDLVEADLTGANVVLTADLSAVESFKRKPELSNLLKMLLLRKIKIQGGARWIIRLYRNRRIVQAVFST